MEKTERPYVTHVVSNLKNPENKHWSIDLGRRTLIVGSNTSHKSTVVQAVELALSGAADDLIGRNAVRDGATILTMASSTSLLCKLVLSDNDTRSYFVEAVDDIVKKPVHAGDPATLPLRLVRDALGGSAQTARRAFFEWVVGTADVSLGETNATLTQLFEQLGRGKTSAQTMLAVLEYVSKKQRSLGQELKGARSVVDELQQEAVEPPSEDELAAARAHLLNCGAHPVDVDAKLDDARRSAGEWNDRVSALQIQCAEENANFYAAAKQLLDVAVFSGSSDCPLCASAVTIEHLQGCQQHYSAALTQQEPLLSQLEDAVQTSLKWRSEVERLEAMSGGGNIAEAQEEFDRLQNAAASWTALTKANKVVQNLTQDIETYKQLKRRIEAQINDALLEYLPAFCKEVSTFLPWEFKTILRDNGRDVFRIGLVKDNQFYAALSGVEWATVTTAIAMAISHDNESPRVLIPEDRAWDSRTLASVMKSFAAFDGQVIMTSTVRPRGRPHSSWTVIDLDADPLLEDAPTPSAPRNGSTGVRRNDDVVMVDSTARLLRGLGYNAATIERMTAETASEIAQEGLLAEYTNVHEDGSFSVAKKDVMDLPRLQP